MKALGMNADVGRDVKIRFDQTKISVGAYGAMTRSAGWRFNITNSKEISFNPTGLEVLVAVPKGNQQTIRFSVDAKIDIKNPMDKWLTWAFTPEKEAIVDCLYAVPMQTD